CRGHARVAERPGKRELGKCLAATLGDLVQGAYLGHRVLAELVGRHRAGPARARSLGDSVEVAIGEHALGERREADAADAEVAERVQKLALDPTVEERVRRLVNEEAHAEIAEDRLRLAGLLSRVRRDADVERLSLADRRRERLHRLLERSLGIEAVRVED